MPHIFISYRREDSAYIASMLRDRLSDHFGSDRIFFDVDNIPLGLDFREHLGQAVGQCDVLLAIIGDDWLTSSNEQGNRLDDPSDFVRIEIEAALGRDIPVVPVLVGKATMPGEEALPESIRNLAFRQAAEIRAGQDLQQHIDRLIRGLREFHDKVLPPKQPPPVATEVIVEDVEVAVSEQGPTGSDHDRGSDQPSTDIAKPPIEPDSSQPHVPSQAEKVEPFHLKASAADPVRNPDDTKCGLRPKRKTPIWKTRVAQVPFLPIVVAWVIGIVVGIVFSVSLYFVSTVLTGKHIGDFDVLCACFGVFVGSVFAIGITFWLLWSRPRLATPQIVISGGFFLSSNFAFLVSVEGAILALGLFLLAAGLFVGLLIWYWRSSSASLEKASRS